MSTPIIVALITGGFAVVVALIQSSRKEQHKDHGIIADTLQQVRREVNSVGRKIDRHIEWHAEGKNDDRSERRD
jgi:hypothetical protein